MEKPSYSNDIDLFDLIESLLAKWKLFSSIVVVGALLTLGYVMSYENKYLVESQLHIVPEKHIAVLNNQIPGSYSKDEIYTRVVSLLGSQKTLFEFLKQDDWQQVLLDNKSFDNEKLKEQYILHKIKGLNIQVNTQPPEGTDDSEQGDLQLYNSKIIISIQGKEQEFLSDLLNSYIHYVNRKLASEIYDFELKRKNHRLERLEDLINTGSEAVKFQRNLEIKQIIDSNNLQLKRLAVQRQALIDAETKKIDAQLKSLRHELKIATQLKIVYPTTLNSLETAKERNNSAHIKVDLDGKSSSPMFLMGTEYLTIKINALLEDKENIEKVNGRVIEIDEKISTLQNDPMVSFLQKEKSLTPYVEKINSMQEELVSLNKYDFDIVEFDFFDVSKVAQPEFNNISFPKRLIAVAGALISMFIALLVTYIMVMYQRHKLTQ